MTFKQEQSVNVLFVLFHMRQPRLWGTRYFVPLHSQVINLLKQEYDVIPTPCMQGWDFPWRQWMSHCQSPEKRQSKEQERKPLDFGEGKNLLPIACFMAICNKPTSKRQILLLSWWLGSSHCQIHENSLGSNLIYTITKHGSTGKTSQYKKSGSCGFWKSSHPVAVVCFSELNFPLITSRLTTKSSLKVAAWWMTSRMVE